ncbi:permease [Romboutsia maritimum]|uniref:Permease n=1 Tax=Romboutsia maritimum TaxID=2020948 RepID=A0A371ISQ5_9FIRM|nr:permease [Romboutsia maritimum]RDY23516.1 permease [Romboutsia maritimum]
MTSFILYGLAIVLFTVSFIKDKAKSKKALKNAAKSFENIMPQFLTIIVIVGIILAVFDAKTISDLLGKESGLLGITISSIVGSIVMMPTFVAFSTGNSLLNYGAGYAQVAALVSTLTLVGIMTFSLESKFIGKKAAFYRNFIAFLFSFIVALIFGVVLDG